MGHMSDRGPGATTAPWEGRAGQPLKDVAISANLHALRPVTKCYSERQPSVALVFEMKSKCLICAKGAGSRTGVTEELLTESSSHMACGAWLERWWWPCFGVPSLLSSPAIIMTGWSSGGCFSCWVQRASFPRSWPVFVPSAPLHSPICVTQSGLGG